MDPLHFCIAVGPLAIYLLVLGIINLSRRPFVTSGGRDTAALGVAVGGFALAGPIELFLPDLAAQRFGPWVWLLLLMLYGLCLTLVVLLVRPRLVVYNTTVDQLRPILATVASELDKDARWAGECLVIPKLGIQLNVEAFSVLRNVQIVSAGPRQNYHGWQYLENELSKALRRINNVPNVSGFLFISCGVVIFSIATLWMLTDQQAVAQALNEILRR